MQELIVPWLDTDNEMNLNVFKCDVYFFASGQKFFHERIPSIIVKNQSGGGVLSFLFSFF